MINAIARIPRPSLPRPLATGIILALLAGPAVAAERDAEVLQEQLRALQERVDSLEQQASSQDSSNASWTLYGSLRLGAGALDDGENSDFNIFSYSSRLGVRGTYAPPGNQAGMPEIFWQIESGLDADAGDGDLASRDTFAGLRGDWGALRAGFFSSPAKSVGRHVDQIANRVGDNRNLLRTDNEAGGQDNRSPGWDNRIGNAIEYATPRIGGVEAAVQYSSHYSDDFDNTTGNIAQGLSARMSFEHGPLWLAGGYETIDRDSDALDDASEADPELYRAAAMLSFSRLTLAGIFQRGEDQQGISGQNRDTFGLGTSYRVTARTWLKAQAYRADEADTLPDSGATLIAGEIEYRLYPQTRFYLSAAHTDNEDAAQFQSTRGLIEDGPAGVDSTSVTLSMRHDF